MVSMHYPLRARARVPFTVLRQSQDMALQCRIVEQIGKRGPLTLVELGRRLYPGRPRNELPLATLELAVLGLRQDGLARKVWFTPRYRLTRAGMDAHRYLVRANWSDLLP